MSSFPAWAPGRPGFLLLDVPRAGTPTPGWRGAEVIQRALSPRPDLGEKRPVSARCASCGSLGGSLRHAAEAPSSFLGTESDYNEPLTGALVWVPDGARDAVPVPNKDLLLQPGEADPGGTEALLWLAAAGAGPRPRGHRDGTPSNPGTHYGPVPGPPRTPWDPKSQGGRPLRLC